MNQQSEYWGSEVCTSCTLFTGYRCIREKTCTRSRRYVDLLSTRNRQKICHRISVSIPSIPLGQIKKVNKPPQGDRHSHTLYNNIIEWTRSRQSHWDISWSVCCAGGSPPPPPPAAVHPISEYECALGWVFIQKPVSCAPRLFVPWREKLNPKNMDFAKSRFCSHIQPRSFGVIFTYRRCVQHSCRQN